MSPKATAEPSFRPSVVVVATATATLMVAQQVGGKATRDALFLSSFDASELPKVMAAAAALSMATVAALSPLMTRFGPARCIPVAFLANSLLFGLEFSLADRAEKWVAVSVYLHFAVFGSAVISGFWSVINERFDPHTAKHVIGRIAGGATFGGVLGGIGAERVASLLSMHAMLLVLGAVNALAAIGVSWIGPRAGAGAQSGEGEPRSGLSILRRTSYLRDLGALVALIAVSSATIDYVFKAEVARAVDRGESLLSFFALFYTATSILTFVVQWLATRHSLERLGLGATVALLPGAMIVLGVLGAALTRATTAAMLRGLSSVLENSLFRSGYELLYTPIKPREKRATKAIIDVAFDRAGTAVGSALVMAVLFFAPSAHNSWLLAGAVVVAVLGLGIALRLHRGYVGALARNLRSGVLRLSEADVLDMTTRRTLAETAIAIDRDELLRQIELLRREHPASAIPRAAFPEVTPSGTRSFESERERTEANGEMVSAVDALCSRDPHRAHAVLAKRPFDPALVTFAIPLLADNALARPAIAALKSVAHQTVGLLADVLLDPEQPAMVRRRLPAVLEALEGERVERGLFLALRDEELDVRVRAAAALSAILERRGAIAVSEAEVLEVVRWELDQRPPAEAAATADDDEQRSLVLHEVVRRRLRRHLEHVFTLLSLVLDRETLTLSLKALFGSDDRLRGTALEYLENVLPGDIRNRLWAELALRPVSREKRPSSTIVQELLRSSEALEIDLERLRTSG